MRTAPEVIEFDVGDLAPVLAAMRDVATREGGGWINLQPAVDPDDLEQQQAGLFGVFSGRGPEVPLCTWSPPGRTRRGDPVVSIGIQHGAGTRLLPLLADIDVTVPGGWRVRQDQPRRGVVIEVPAGEDHERVLAWLLEAGEAACRPPHRGWLAVVHRPR